MVAYLLQGHFQSHHQRNREERGEEISNTIENADDESDNPFIKAFSVSNGWKHPVRLNRPARRNGQNSISKPSIRMHIHAKPYPHACEADS